MTENKTMMAVIVVIVLVAASGGSYIYTKNLYEPQIGDLFQSLDEKSTEIDELNDSLEAASQEIEEKDADIASLNSVINDLQLEKSVIEDEYSETLDLLNETENEMMKFKRIAFDFYETNPIRIGLVSPSELDEPIIRAIADLAEQDIHQYCRSNDLPYRFEFVISNNQMSLALADSNTVTYDTLGINLIVGHWFEESVSSSLQYINDNDMLMISPSSSSVQLAIADDNLFRLTPDDSRQLDIVIKCMKEMGKEKIIILAENIDWAKELVNDYRPKITLAGLDIESTVWYPSDPDMRTSSLNQFSRNVEEAVFSYGSDKVCVYVIGWDVLDQAIGQMDVDVVDWFGTDVFTYIISYTGDVASKLVNVKVLSPRPAYNTTEFNDFGTRIEEICGYRPSIYSASAYDACWLYAYSIIETGSMNVTSIKEVLPEVSNGYIGVSGDCTLNAAGDKNDSDYRIMGFIRTHIDEADFTDYGYYDSGNDTITWLIDPGIEAVP